MREPPREPAGSPSCRAGTPGKAAVPRRQFASLRDKAAFFGRRCSDAGKGRFILGAPQCPSTAALNGLFMVSKRNTSAAVLRSDGSGLAHGRQPAGRECPVPLARPPPAAAGPSLASRGVLWAPPGRGCTWRRCGVLSALSSFTVLLLRDVLPRSLVLEGG